MGLAAPDSFSKIHTEGEVSSRPTANYCTALKHIEFWINLSLHRFVRRSSQKLLYFENHLKLKNLRTFPSDQNTTSRVCTWCSPLLFFGHLSGPLQSSAGFLALLQYLSSPPPETMIRSAKNSPPSLRITPGVGQLCCLADTFMTAPPPRPPPKSSHFVVPFDAICALHHQVPGPSSSDKWTPYCFPQSSSCLFFAVQ